MSTDLIHDEYNPFSGLRARVHFDDVDGLYHVEHIGDVEPTLERNKAVYNGHSGWASDRTGESAGGLQRHVASIPPVAMVGLLDQGIDIFAAHDDDDQQRRLGRVLNSSEFRFLRTTPGRI